MRQLATRITPNLGNHNRKIDWTMVWFSSVLWIFSVHRTEPANTTLQSMVREYCKTPVKTHLSPLQKLVERFNIKPWHFETIKPDPLPPTYKRAFTVTIADSKEELIKREAEDNSDVKIYTGFEGNVGAAAVLYRKGSEEPEKILCFHLGSLKKHTTFEGEAVGSILAAWMLQG